MKISFYEATYQGARSSNQDAYSHAINDDWCCFVVADGLGGHYNGEIASSVYTSVFIKAMNEYAHLLMSDPIDGMKFCIQNAWQHMCKQIQQQYGTIDSQTTLVVMWMNAAHLVTAHVGDSRLYLLDANDIIWRTPDHTPVQALFEQGKITEEDFYHHPMQNRLLRTVNLFEPPQADIVLHSPLPVGDTVLLCSDGFWNPLSRNDILLLGKTNDFKGTATKLLDAILADHPADADNITLQLIRGV